MTKAKKKTTSKKTKRTPMTVFLTGQQCPNRRTPPANRAALNDPELRAAVRRVLRAAGAPQPDALEHAKADFDAAGIACMTACLAFVDAGPVLSPRNVAAQSAGFALKDAYAAVLRARDAAPIPHGLTSKAKRAKLTPKPSSKARRMADMRSDGSGPNAKRGGSK
jgi:hypothetical protein